MSQFSHCKGRDETRRDLQSAQIKTIIISRMRDQHWQRLIIQRAAATTAWLLFLFSCPALSQNVTDFPTFAPSRTVNSTAAPSITTAPSASVPLPTAAVTTETPTNTPRTNTPTTNTPITQPTSERAITVTLEPTLSPTSTPTAYDTYQVTVVLVLQNVTTAMSPVHRTYFGPTLALYLEQVLAPKTALGYGWTGELQHQALLESVPSNAGVRNRNRNLQSITVAAPLATQTLITTTQRQGLPPLPISTVEFYIREELQDGSKFLQFLLNQTLSPTLIVYFEKIKSVTLFPSNSTIAQQDPGSGVEESDNDDDGFSLWTIVGIAGGIGFCLLCVVGGALLFMQPETIHNTPRNDNSNSSPRFSTSPSKKLATQSNEEDTIYNNPSIMNPPTVTPNDADEQSYAYSLQPGSFTETAKASPPKSVAPPKKVAVRHPQPTPADEETTVTTLRRNMVSRQVRAPPGKLGIVIDTSLEGPVVHKVNENSPLLGKIFQGDIITSINSIDTRAMKASAITTIMVRTAHEPRLLTVLSEDTTQS